MRLALDNDIKHQIARNVFHLRRARRMSQGVLAEAMGTSQSAVARIEAAEDNLTVGTLQRLIVALHGRLLISIQPAEMPSQRPPPWWKTADTQAATAWTVRFVALNTSGDTERAVIGVERTAPGNALLVATSRT